MARAIHKLNVLQASKLTKPGRHGDGGGLYLSISKDGRRRWVFVYRQRGTGKLREMGLGAASTVTLAKARTQAAAARELLAAGQDPIDDRVTEAEVVPTFGAMAEEVISSLESGWRNPKHRAQWRSTVATYCAPILAKPVDRIATTDVLAILKPIWTTKHETAGRVRGRIEKVLDAAKAKGHRSSENPARWRGHLDHLLAKPKKAQRHHPAMPYDKVPAFIGELREREGVAARCLEFTILTAARSGEARGALWSEIDLEAKIWTIPDFDEATGRRMKGNRVHRVPLTERALAIVQELAPLRAAGDLVFPGTRPGAPLSDMTLDAVLRRMKLKPFTVHGFRSSFKDWATETTAFPNELSEAALAHTTGDKVERAYRRGDALARRRELMQAWASYVEPLSVDNVVPLNRPA